MVRIKGKKKASTSNNLNENEFSQDALVETENSVSMIVNMEQTSGGAHSENKEIASLDVTKNEEDEERKHEELNVIVHALVETENSDPMIVNIEQTSGGPRSENKEMASLDVTKNEEDEERKHEEQNVIVHALVETENSDSMIVNMEQTSGGARSENKEMASMDVTKNEDEERKHEEQNAIVHAQVETENSDSMIVNMEQTSGGARSENKETTSMDATKNEETKDEEQNAIVHAQVETENSDSMIVNMEQTIGGAPSENKETASMDVTKNEEDEETKREEQNVIIQKGEKSLEDAEDTQVLNGYNLTEEDQNSENAPEDDEDNQEGPMEEDDEDNQEDSMEEYDEEDTSEEEDEVNGTFEDDDSEEDATEEEEDDNEKNAEEEEETAEGDSEKAEEYNEENMGALRKKKAKKSGETIRRKVIENSIANNKDSEENKMKEEDNGAKGDKENAGDGQNAEVRNAEKLETSSKEKVKKSRQRNRKKVEDGSSKKVASGAEDRPESSTKKKSKKRAESMGMIFMCSSQTKNDCYHYKVLGLPSSKRDLVKKIYKGMRLFLYDTDLKLMYGIYKAAGPGGYNIEPKAFKSQFPSQVRFTIFDDCLPVAEEKFKTVIKENYFTRNKFDCQLTSSQVKKLCKLFVPARKANQSNGVERRWKAENPKPVRGERKRRRRGDDGTPIRRERNRRQRRDDERHTSLRVERRQHEPPRKRQRDVRPVAPQWQRPPLPAPARQPLSVPSYAYRRTPGVNVYRLDPYLNDRDPYRGGRDPYVVHRDPYREGLDPNIQHLDSSRDGLRLAPRDSYRREPILVHPDVYRQDRVAYSDSYRRDELLEHRDLRSSNLETRPDEIGSRDLYVPYRDHPSNLETRRREEIVSRAPYVSYQDRPSYADPLYSTERHSQTTLVPEYRLSRPITDHHSTRDPLPEYRSRGTLSRY